MRIGSLTVDSVIDGETSRTLPYLYASAPEAELAAAESFRR
ncbi:hypothetical protein [Arthrobacter sp. AZCC_0090]|nr:hypothetical protein [Arthrobacter sp. AZCC_0090]MBB6407170.1 hypothetical protein [Arthrobacter sp. AZCC_0090]